MNSVCDDPGAFRCGGDQIISRLRSSFSGPSALHVTGRCRAPPTAEGPGEVWWRVGAFTRAPEERNYNGTPGHSAPLGHLFQLGPRLPLLPARLELRFATSSVATWFEMRSVLGLLGECSAQNQRRDSGPLRFSYMRPMYYSPQNTL